MVPTSICLSHKEDVDGITSAALIKAAFDTEHTILVDYPNLMPELEKIALRRESNVDGPDMLYICDVGLSKKNEQKFVSFLDQIVSNGCEVIYIDHHDLTNEIALTLKKSGVVLIHTTNECTSVQVYHKFKKRLPSQAAFFAAAGALTDYMEDRPLASVIVSRFDRQFLMLEAGALSYMISANQNDDRFLNDLVETLSQMKYPHEVKNGFAIAQKYAQKVSQAIKAIEVSIKKTRTLAYAPSMADSSASMVVNFVLGLSDRPVALVYKLKNDIKSYVISIRGSKDCKVHLGRIVNDIASQLGGSGGGHDKACGAVIPQDKLEAFIKLLSDRIAS